MFFMNGNFILSTPSEFSECFSSDLCAINGDTNAVSTEAIQSIACKHGVPRKLL